MTRVLLVHQPVDGGVARNVCDLAHGLSARGYEVVLCGPAPPNGLDNSAISTHLDLQRAVAPRTDIASVAKLARIVRELEPDVIHAHSSKAGAVARLTRAAYPRTPVLYSPHGYAFKGHFSHERERRTYRTIERVLAPLASRVICVCEAEARAARAVGPSQRVRVVYNGIAPAEDGPIDPRIAELTQAGPVIGALTLLRPGKGLETLIDALPHVLQRHPNAQLAILGDGPDLDTLRERTALRGAAHAAHFLGPTTRPLDALRGMDVFVHPSWAESFPYVILEAMSLGRAIIASNVGGVSEAIVDRESGLLVPPRNPDALSDALNALLDDRTLSSNLGNAAQTRQRARFTLAQMLHGTTQVYEEVTALRRRDTSS